MQIVQTSASYVDQSRTESVGKAGSALLRVSGLVSLSEAATVSDAAEDSGNELRIVGQAEAEEELVLVAEVDVHARIKRVAMLEELRRCSEVTEESRRGWVRVEVEQSNRVGVQPPRGENVQYRA